MCTSLKASQLRNFLINDSDEYVCYVQNNTNHMPFCLLVNVAEMIVLHHLDISHPERILWL